MELKQRKIIILSTLLSVMCAGFLGLSPMALAQNSPAADDSTEKFMMGSLSDWCDNVGATLSVKQSKAQIQYTSNNFNFAVDTLKNGLSIALQNADIYTQDTLTYITIKRSLNIVNNFHASKDNVAAHKSMYTFLSNRYKFIKKLSIQEASIHPSKPLSYEIFAHEQVRLTLKSLVLHSEGKLFPKGDPNFVLAALGETVESMVMDLSQSLNATYYACKIEAAKSILSEWQNTSLSTFKHFRFLVENVHALVRSSTNCPYRYGKHHVSYNEYYDGHHYSDWDGYSDYSSDWDGYKIWLEKDWDLKYNKDGTVKEAVLKNQHSFRSDYYLNLPNKKYIKKIIVDAEGVYNDAQAQVMVGSEIKGTIYAPAKDPTYHITIEEPTDLIKFEMEMGKLRVLKIVVVFDNDITWYRD